LAVPQKISNGSSLIKTGIAEYSPFYYKPKSEITWRGGTEYTYNITIEGSTLSVTTRTSICRSTAGAASGSGCVTFIVNKMAKDAAKSDFCTSGRHTGG
jgi:hypothetical protein